MNEENKKNIKPFMLFESTMKQFFGNKADRIQDSASDLNSIKKWLIKATKEIIKKIDKIDTATRHKKMLLNDAENLLDDLKDFERNKTNVILQLFSLCSKLFGYDYQKGITYHTPFYYQTNAQHWNENLIKENNYFRNEKNVMEIRKKIISELKKQGLDNYHISIVFNTSEYQIKKLRKNL
jgi:hypothetical protein